jgi:hypothetical protein
VQAAVQNEDLREKLADTKYAAVIAGRIWLKRVPRRQSNAFFDRDSVQLTPRLWKKIWENSDWIEAQMGEPSGKGCENYEEDVQQDCKVAGEQNAGCKGQEVVGELCREPIDATGEKSEGCLPDTSLLDTLLSSLNEDGICSSELPQESNLEEDPEWYRMRIEKSAQKRKQTAQKQEAKKRRIQPLILKKKRSDFATNKS